MHWIDIGANLTHESFADDLPQVLEDATEAGVRQLVVTGADLDGSQAAIALAQDHPGRLFATVGVHPHHASQTPVDLLDELLADEHVVAAGEMGLDFFRDFSPRPAQEKSFHQQLELAAKHQLPAFLHCREAFDRFLPIWKEHATDVPRGVTHCFTGSEAELDACLEAGLYVGITGWICDERRGKHLKSIVDKIPPDRIMVETDCPYLLPRDLDPKPNTRRNEPKYLPHIGAEVAQCRGENVERFASQSSDNARGFFGLP